MVIDEDPFSQVASINIFDFNFKAMLNVKKVEEFSLNAKIRKVWILK